MKPSSNKGKCGCLFNYRTQVYSNYPLNESSTHTHSWHLIVYFGFWPICNMPRYLNHQPNHNSKILFWQDFTIDLTEVRNNPQKRKTDNSIWSMFNYNTWYLWLNCFDLIFILSIIQVNISSNALSVINIKQPYTKIFKINFEKYCPSIFGEPET